MISSEFTVFENEWQDLLQVRGYIKRAFDVDIKKKDGFDSTDRGSQKPYSALTSSFEVPHCSDFQLQGTEISEKGIVGEGFILRPPPVIALIETSKSSAVGNLEKCRKFMCAFTPSNPDYESITLNVQNQRALDMVQEIAAIIQQSTSALICVQPDQLEFTIKGHKSCVASAQQKIEMILRDPNSMSLMLDGNVQSLTEPLGVGSTNNSSSAWNVLQEPNKLNKNSNNDLISSSHVFKDRSHDLSKDTTVSGLSSCQFPREPCESSCDCSSDEDILLSDDRFKSHVAQASKCGFSDRQISNVLKKLDLNCSMDDMMKELVKAPQEDNDSMLCLSDLKSCNEALLTSNEEEDLSSEEGLEDDSSNLRDIIIDGSNVAMSHGQKVFSCKGIKIAVDWFKSRGHKNITVFVPQWRKEASRPDAPISDQEILAELEEERIVVFTPSRRVGGTRIVCYDDRYVLKLAVQTNGIVVSNDVYRDLVRERDDFKEVVEKRLLMYTFVKDSFMPPEDPYGRQGPSLDNFLRIKPAEPKHRPPNCPYGKKCTYGMKCKYYHPERRCAPQKMVAEKLKESAELRLKSSKSGDAVEKGRGSKPKLSRTVSLTPNNLGKIPPPVEVFIGAAETKKPPPLKHSKSLVYPNSYLTELRLKMEQAECEETEENTSSQAPNSVLNFEKTIENLTNNSDMCVVTPGTSQSPVSFPPSTAPDFPPYLGHVSAANAESQSRNLSDHLLVAKKLSDEDSSGENFFAQHTSRNSGSSLQDRNGCTDQLSPLSSIRNPQPQTSLQPQDSPSLDSQEIFLPPGSPFSSYYSPLSPTASEVYSSSSGFSHSAKSYPVPQTHHQLLKRSISSTAPSRSPDHQLPRHADRKHSLNTLGIQHSAENYLQTRAFASMPPPPLPVSQTQPSVNYPYQIDYKGKKESVDSAIGSGLSGEQTFLMYRSPTEDLPSPFYSSPNAPSPTTFFPPHQNFSQPMMRSPQQQQQNVAYMSSPHRLVPQSNVITSQAHSSYPAASNVWQFYQHSSSTSSPSRLPVDNSFVGHGGDVGNFPSPGFPPPSVQMQQGHHHSHLVNSPPLGIYYSAPPQLQTTTTNVQHHHHPFYPTNSSASSYYLPMASAYGTAPDVGRSDSMYEPNTPGSPYSQGPPLPLTPRTKDIDEEAPIRVDDPRYTLYYNLSSVYGERVVRTFMNRNPDISGSNIKNLHSMISAYKQERGM